MESLNRVELVASVSRNTVTRIGDTKVARMTVATNYAYKDKKGEPVCETTFINVTVFQEKAKTDLENIKDWSIVRVKGRLRNIRFTDAATGAERTVIEILASDLELISEAPAPLKPELTAQP